jgi:hypothetical protein
MIRMPCAMPRTLMKRKYSVQKMPAAISQKRIHGTCALPMWMAANTKPATASAMGLKAVAMA